jgi:hypothetical protein
MKTKLDRLLESVDPAHTLDQVSARVDEALNSFQMKSGIIEDWDKFRTVMTNLYRHVENHIFRIPPSYEPDADFDWGRCYQLLVRATYS